MYVLLVLVPCLERNEILLRHCRSASLYIKQNFKHANQDIVTYGWLTTELQGLITKEKNNHLTALLILWSFCGHEQD